MYIQTKRIVLSTLFAALLLGSVAMPAQAQFGVAAGLNFETADGINTSSGDATFENATGYHLGVVYDAAAGPLKIRPGLLYRKVGEYEFPDDRTEIERFEVPVDLKFTLPVPLVTPYLLGCLLPINSALLGSAVIAQQHQYGNEGLFPSGSVWFLQD